MAAPGQLAIGKYPAVRTDAPLADDPAMVVTLRENGSVGANVNIAGWFGAITPTVGQKTMAASIPVVIASDQTSLPTQGVTSSTTARSAVGNSAISVVLVASNAARLGLSIQNDSNVDLYLAAGSTPATTTDYTCLVRPGGFWEPPAGERYTGEVRGIWASASTGGARITQYLA